MICEWQSDSPQDFAFKKVVKVISATFQTAGQCDANLLKCNFDMSEMRYVSKSFDTYSRIQIKFIDTGLNKSNLILGETFSVATEMKIQPNP